MFSFKRAIQFAYSFDSQSADGNILLAFRWFLFILVKGKQAKSGAESYTYNEEECIHRLNVAPANACRCAGGTYDRHIVCFCNARS